MNRNSLSVLDFFQSSSAFCNQKLESSFSFENFFFENNTLSMLDVSEQAQPVISGSSLIESNEKLINIDLNLIILFDKQRGRIVFQSDSEVFAIEQLFRIILFCRTARIDAPDLSITTLKAFRVCDSPPHNGNLS